MKTYSNLSSYICSLWALVFIDTLFSYPTLSWWNNLYPNFKLPPLFKHPEFSNVFHLNDKENCFLKSLQCWVTLFTSLFRISDILFSLCVYILNLLSGHSNKSNKVLTWRFRSNVVGSWMPTMWCEVIQRANKNAVRREGSGQVLCCVEWFRSPLDEVTFERRPSWSEGSSHGDI